MDPQRQELYEVCQRNGVGITVMKAFGGGDLLSAELSPAGKALTPYQCIHYALTRPAVACVMAGARSMEELEASIAYETAGEEEKDYAAAFASMPKISWQGHCIYCGHCAPCPAGIDIAMVNKLYDLALMQEELPASLKAHYDQLSANADACIGCKSCESRCPFGVKIAERMARTKEHFKG